ncbi:MAG: tyrosine-type recombinase/integrase [Methanosarcinaceae archaeon]
MMSNKCPVIERVGLCKITIVELFQRFFGVANLLSRKRKAIEKPKPQKRTLSNAGYHLTLKEVLKIIDSCSNERNRVLIQTLVFTGMRRAEVTALIVKDILWDKNLLLIRHGKGNKQRLIPIPKELLVNLKGLLGNRSFGAVFQSRNDKQLSMRQVNRIVAKAGEDAGVDNPNPKYDNITCHLFRHTFARLWKEKQGSIETLSTVLGHQSVSTTWDEYGKESMEDIKNNYNKVIKQMFEKIRTKKNVSQKYSKNQEVQ